MSNLKQNIPLKDFSNYKIGGNASFFLEITTIDDLTQGVKRFREIQPQGNIFILGSGTNVLFSDDGFDGLIVFNKLGGIRREGNAVKIESGVQFSDLLNFCIDNSLSGIEWAGGLPGTVGGAVRGNAGAFGGETKDSVLKVTSISLTDYSEVIRQGTELGFSYRNSTYKSGEGKNDFITEVEFVLSEGTKDDIKARIQEKIDYRWARHPMDLPNIGSTFKNIPAKDVPQEKISQFQLPIKNDPFPVVPTAKILSVAGLIGKRVGDAQVSEKHPNFIVNLGNAKASEVLELIKIEKETVKEKMGIDLEEEIIIL